MIVPSISNLLPSREGTIHESFSPHLIVTQYSRRGVAPSLSDRLLKLGRHGIGDSPSPFAPADDLILNIASAIQVAPFLLNLISNIKKLQTRSFFPYPMNYIGKAGSR